MRGGGPVSAAAMRARAVDEQPTFRSRHCSTEEYDAFLAACRVSKGFVAQRRSHRKLFVQAWPNLEEWLHAPLAVRVGRVDGQTRATLYGRPSYHARAYLYYLALSGYLRLDYPWLLSIGDLCVHDVAYYMCLDLGVKKLAREAAALGLRHANAELSIRWALGRIAVHSGPRPVDQLGDKDVDELLVAIRRFSERPDLDTYWTSGDRYRAVSKSWITKIGQLRLVLYHRGQVHEAPRKAMPGYTVPSVQPEMAALTQKWLERRAAALRPSTVYHLALTMRSFLGHLAVAAPEVQTFAAVRHEHVISWMNALATELSTKTGRPLTPYSQRGRVVRLAQFFKDAEDWAWPDVPRWPLVAKRDLPRPPTVSHASSLVPISIGLWRRSGRSRIRFRGQLCWSHAGRARGAARSDVSRRTASTAMLTAPQGYGFR